LFGDPRDQGTSFWRELFCLTKSFPGTFKAFLEGAFLSFFTEAFFKILDWEKL
jgi:hypothetical protein